MQGELGTFPSKIRNVDELDEVLTRPDASLIEFIRTLPSPLVVLGAAGKMGPSLCLLAKRASELAGSALEVVAVSRYRDRAIRDWLGSSGIKTVPADLFKRDEVAMLPDAENVVFLVGQKFGTRENPEQTWATNTLVPAWICERYAKSKIVALSTGNVYPMMTKASGGSVESDAPAPLGEYANACLARERLFEYFSNVNQTPLALIRLNYAIELRYGVLVDISTKVWRREAIDLSVGWLNCIWQRDANDMILRALGLVSNPPGFLNLTGPDILSVRQVAEEIGRCMDRPPVFSGTESETALLSNPSKICAALGAPPTPISQAIRWTSDWIKNGQPTSMKPTHFEVRDGKY